MARTRCRACGMLASLRLPCYEVYALARVES